MRVVQLNADNFKRLVAVEISPEGNVVEVTGRNGSGKSSVLDAIYVALVGRSVAPPKPVRDGEEQCRIRLDLGDLVVNRTFTVKDGDKFTDTVKVENADGLRYSKPQEVLDALLGEIGFDPFEFCQMKPADQADTLLRMVPLPVDLDELAEQDQSDFANRRDLNRDLAARKAELGAIPKEDVPKDIPDREALTEQLGNAANANSERARLQLERDVDDRQLGETDRDIEDLKTRLAEWEESRARLAAKIDARGDLPEPVDTDAIREQLRTAEALLATVDRQKRRDALAAQVKELAGKSEALTGAMDEREKARQAALSKAQMPIDGLGFRVDERGKPLVTFGGVPFEQASTAEQLRASTAIAMAANPSLRVLRVKDGSLLDEDSMKLLAEMAAEQDFQLWVERVGTGGVGVQLEAGKVVTKGKAKAEAKAGSDKPEGALV